MIEPRRSDTAVGPLSDYGQQASRYEATRELSEGSIRAYAEMTHDAVQGMSPISAIGDIGSGTGRFSSLLVEWFGGRVIAIEPHEHMRAIAVKDCHPSVVVRHGEASATGLDDESLDLIWLAHVVHHLRPLQPALVEMFRVLRPGGRLLVTNGLGDFPEGFPETQSFPEVVDIVKDRFPHQAQLTRDFKEAGFQFDRRRSRKVEFANSTTELIERFTARTLTTLQLLPDAVFDRRLAELRKRSDISLEQPTTVEHHILRFDKPGA